MPAHLLHHSDDARDERVRVRVLPGAGVQVHASLLKHHLGAGTGRARVQGAARAPHRRAVQGASLCAGDGARSLGSA